MVKGKLRHIAISVPDKERAAKFYEERFGFERVSQSRVATRLSDGVMNITLLQFETEEDAGDERRKNFGGLHHFGIWVDDIDAMKKSIEAHGGKYHPGPSGHTPANGWRCRRRCRMDRGTCARPTAGMVPSPDPPHRRPVARWEAEVPAILIRKES
jgi:catechol 2,3-dioxygenase-like lactoylglutathione lyase family enzyme